MSIGTRNANIKYLNVSCGKFKYRDEEYGFVDGTYIGHVIEHDEGNAERHIDPYDKITLTLVDGDETYYVSGRMGTCYSWMLASYMDSVSPGDVIGIDVKPGTDNSKVTVCFVKKGKKNVPRIDMGDDKHAKALEVFRNHPGYGADAMTTAGPVSLSDPDTTAADEQYDPFDRD